MTENYVRKKVGTVVRRGLQELNRPLPEKADEEDGGGKYIYSHTSYRDSAFAGDSFDDVSEPSTAHTPAGSHSWLAMSNGWTTGQSTGRSSICSFGEDEFDREASKKVRHLFEDIEKMLYENYQGHEPLRTECKDWINVFPHLRVTGRQLLSPQDNGYQVVPSLSSPTTPHSEDISESDSSYPHISVMGQQMSVLSPPVDSLYSLPENDLSSYETEEVFAMDGVLEDIIAIDKSIQDEENEKNSGLQSGQRKNSGFPPVNPKALLKDNIGGIVFDTTWSEVISWLRLLLRNYSSRIIPENLFDLDEQLMQQVDSGIPGGYLPMDRREDTMGMAPSREISYLSGTRMVDKYAPRLGTASSGTARNVALDGLLTISSKALQSREKSSLQSEQDTIPTSRPESSFLPYHMGRQASARTRAQRGKLAPIDRIRTPSQDEDRHAMRPNEVLRGRSIGASTTDSLIPQPLGLHRNGTLPPISLESETSYGKKKPTTIRASSAIHHDKDSHMVYRERTRDSLIMESARPSTTHGLYRAETSLGNRQRSSTPQLFNSSRISHGPMPISGLVSGGTTNIMQLNVTGSSIYPLPEDSTAQSMDMESHYDSVSPQNWGRERRRRSLGVQRVMLPNPTKLLAPGSASRNRITLRLALGASLE